MKTCFRFSGCDRRQVTHRYTGRTGNLASARVVREFFRSLCALILQYVEPAEK